MRRRLAISSLGSLVGAAALGTWSSQARAQTAGVADDRIVLGQSAPFSGSAAQLGLQFNLGAQLHFEAVNAKGGINGRRIELQRLDDGYEPERCAANTRQFIGQNVFALFGYVGTPTSLAALPLATEAKVPFFAPFTGAQALREPFNRYAIHVRASYFDETAAIVRQVTSVGIRKLEEELGVLLFERGGHGFGMRHQDLTSDRWLRVLEDWMQMHGWLTAGTLDTAQS